MTLLPVHKEKITRKLLVYFLLLFINTEAVFAQNLSESEVKQACISDRELSALTSNCHQNIGLTKNKKVQKTCAQDIQYCSDKIICFLATVKRHGKRFWATSGNGSKYLKEASRRDLTCGKLPPELQEPPFPSSAPKMMLGVGVPAKPPLPSGAPEIKFRKGAPKRSLRPRLRPTENTALTQSNSVALALQEALSAPRPETATPSYPSGFQMTSDTKTVILRDLKPCWKVDVGSLSADIVVTLRWKMSPDGKLVAGSLRMIDSEGGDGSALRSAVQIAKSTVFRCGNRMGANLPPEKYDEWQEIEVRFDPSEMRTGSPKY